MIRRAVILICLVVMVLLPAAAPAEMKWSLDEPAAGFASNSVGDIVYTVTPQGDTVIWVGTGNGLSKSTDGGASWVTYNRQTGLNENDISALSVADTSLWVACAYTQLEDGEVVPYGKGFNQSSNFGESWDSFIPWQVDFAGMLAYDIAIDDTTFWAACWYGGLIHCLRDYDSLICENVFVDSFSRNDFEGEYFNYLNNRFFSVVVDTNCPIQKRLKNSINDIFYDGKLIWVATQNGLHASADYGQTYFSYDTISGLNSNGIYCLGGDSTIILAGLYQEEETTPLPLIPDLTGTDFSVTTDYGYTWNTSHPSQGQASAEGKSPLGVVKADTVIWAVCGRGGLIRSFDRGQNWENVFVDTAAQRRFQEEQLLEEDVFTAVAVDTSRDTIFVWAGTKDGVYKMIFTVSDSPDTVYRYLYYSSGGGMGNGPTDPSVGIVRIGIQTANDQKSIWLAGYSFYTYNPTPDDIYPVTLKSTDGGTTWNSYLGGIQARDFAIWDTTIWIATEEGLKRSKDGGEHWDTFEIIDSTSGDLLIPSYFTSVYTGLDAGGLTVLVGSSDGLAITRNEGITWEVTKFIPTYQKAIWAGSAAGIYKFLYNLSSEFDTVLGYSQDSLGLTGDFVVSLAIQQYSGRKIIWAGTQPTYSGGYGISYTTDDGNSWNTTLLGDRVWNFAFDDSVIWVATSAGVKRSDDWGASWKVFDSINGLYTTEFSSVAIIGGEVWVGSADGLAWSSDNGNTWDTVRTAAPIVSGAYAYPSPFSPVVEEGQVTRIRYRPLKDGSVSIKVYDFAMNLVKMLEDNQQRSGGSEYEAVWDGRNGKGEIVANGVYFFKVEAPGGQTEWGKVVVLK